LGRVLVVALGRPDLVNRRRKVAVFVDGDFWHGNLEEWRRRGFDSMEAQFRVAKREHWTAKLRRNVERDREVHAALAAAGWEVLRFWESEVSTDLDAVADQIAARWTGGTDRLKSCRKERQERLASARIG
jgi:DNA mismatch endonuclease, patch repair protein